MSTGGPDLFVICKNCQSEVSPYITECPYCGSRLRKRAPKLDRDGRVTERKRRSPSPSLPRLRRGEIPGIRGESRPYATIVLVLAGFAGTLLWRAAVVGSTSAIELWARYGTHLWWRLLVAPFTYTNTGYAIVALGTIALYGWLLERRHGPLLVLALFAIAAVGGAAVTATNATLPLALGANGGALALLVAWAIPDLLSLRGGREIEGDLLGTAVIAVVVALMPLAVPGASWISAGVGVAAGFLIGLPLALAGER
ncbi:MAG TPA: rhomboid family intramembrane serine protease [Solirubrobacteraceae bacterium]|nr:rhomboid family intramembrane serine protease [Solirubrobacteraceae bacterium]